MRNLSYRLRGGLALTAVAALIGCAVAIHRQPEGFGWRPAVSSGDYADRAARVIRLLETSFYNGTGLWHMCIPAGCFTKNRDWGADSLTYVLYLRWVLERD